ncbi:MAG: hypothetical protein ACK41C_08695 [Phenylobacterium sp.]|jgi:hypothetical protein|uniref:hypothetical protein n=1 Tax=Phenylobacterium sp. TaxID=1871053 RepID=UPI00391A5C0F
MRHLGLGLAFAVLLGGPAAAQVDTPPNCHWVGASPDARTLELWCRGDDGRARPTGRMLHQSGTAPPDCPRGQVYDGARCIAEAAALAALPQAPYVAPPPAVAGPYPKGPAPRVLLFRDRRGQGDRGMACVDDRGVTVCRPIPVP